MEKISKKMVKDYQKNRKKSYLESSQTVYISESSCKEEYDDGRTIYKISKQKPSPNFRFNR